MEPVMETMDCAKCPCRINRNEHLFATCRGPCGKSYHALCAGLLTDQVSALSESVFWLCGGCSAAFGKWKTDFQPEPVVSLPNPVEAEIAELKFQVTNILDTLATIKTNLSTCSPPVSSTPVASSTLFDGTNDNKRGCFCDTNTSQIDASVKNDSKDFSLFLTNVNSSTTVEEICAIVSRCLGAPTIECRQIKKLVPKWVDCKTLEYVSFKIDLNEKWKSLALTASTWPRGIKFREFWSRSNCTWKPDCE